MSSPPFSTGPSSVVIVDLLCFLVLSRLVEDVLSLLLVSTAAADTSGANSEYPRVAALNALSKWVAGAAAGIQKSVCLALQFNTPRMCWVLISDLFVVLVEHCVGSARAFFWKN
jgi:hypothetical protein